MACRYCRKKIGPVRKLRDPHFCCDDHRQKATSKSARAVREAEDLYGLDQNQLPTWRAITQAKREEKQGKGGMSTTVFAGLAVVFVILALSQLPMGSAPAKSISPLPDTGSHSSRSGFAQMVGNLLQNQGSGTLREDFHGGAANWVGAIKTTGSDWATESGLVRPSSLRVWKQSTSLSNYEMEFM